MALSGEERHEEDQTRRIVVCLACGILLQEPLAYLGSLRCMDCRAAAATLDPQLVEEWQAGGAHLH